MAGDWLPLRLDAKLFQNLPEIALTRASAVLVNLFINESGGHSRFPGLVRKVTFPDGGRVYLEDFRGELMAATSRGRLYRVARNFSFEDVTGVPIGGGLRAIFTETEDELVVAAGGPIIRFAGTQTEVLSETAPISTHVAYLDGFLTASERDSNRFFHSQAGAWRTWDPIDTFTAEAKPDPVTVLAVTPYRELLIGGAKSIEQFERLADGQVPFFRRWAVGEGVWAPYTFVAADNGSWVVNQDLEFVRFSNQNSQPASDDIQYPLEAVSDWTDAWAAKLHTGGHKFMVLQMPRAMNPYGTLGLTFLFDYKARRWSELYGWDDAAGTHARWPGWSVKQIGGTTYVGGEGCIYVLDPAAKTNDGQRQRLNYRSGHYAGIGRAQIANFRMHVARGFGGANDNAGILRVRVRKDGVKWTRWLERSLGAMGDRDVRIEFGNLGETQTMQVEYEVDSPVSWDFRMAEVVPDRIDR